jgi:hypothetical protein
MAPYSGYLASRAALRLSPWIILPQFKDLLDFGSNKEYQDLIVWGLNRPVLQGGALRPKITALSVSTNKKGLHYEAHLFRHSFLSCQSIVKISPLFSLIYCGVLQVVSLP